MKPTRYLLWVLAASASLAITAHGPVVGNPVTPASDPEARKELEKRIARLVLQLGAPQMKAREDATRALTKIGEPARAQLTTALRSDDAEVRRRAGEILKALNKAVLAQTEVHVVGLYHAGRSELEAKDIIDWPGFWKKVREQGASAKPSPGRRIWELLPEKAREVARDDATLKVMLDPQAIGRRRKLMDAGFTLGGRPQADSGPAGPLSGEGFRESRLLAGNQSHAPPV